MASIGKYRKKLDLGLLARMAAGTVFQPKPLKRKSEPRAADTYRANKPYSRGARRTEQHAPAKLIARDAATNRAMHSKTYKPNGKRECARRVRQMAAR